MANVKAIYLDSNGVYRPAGSGDTIDVGDIKLLNQTVNNGVLSTDSSGVVTSALLDNDNVAANAAIAGSKINPDFTGQTVSGNGSGLTALNASNLGSGTVPDARFPATLPAVSGANLTNLDADELATGTVPSARISGAYSGITGVGIISTGTWQGGAIADTYLGTISAVGKVENSATSATASNVGDKIVLRDIQGNFAAGVVTADLIGDVTGNASSADKWSTERNVSFNGDISGNFDIDGSANVSNVQLTINAGAVIESTIAIGAVTADKIGTGAVTNDKIATATSDADANSIVLRNSLGNFSANVIFADLTGDVTGDVSGNAGTASKWATSRQVSFSGGDVSGSFDIDGSQNVSSVALTIGSGVVENSMLAGSITEDKLAGSIPDSKLQTISSAGKVADTALSSNVAKYDAAAPAFANKLGVGSVTAADVAKAATVQFVLDQVAAAEAGLDYKQEAQWYIDSSSVGWNVSDITDIINTGYAGAGPITNKFTDGDRLLVISADAVESGIYVINGSNGSWVLSRATDMATGSDAAGAYLFCQTQILITEGGAPGQPPTYSLSYPALNASYVCNDKKGDAVVGSDALTFIQYGIAPVYTGTAPIAVNGTAISIVLGSGVEELNGALVANVDSSTIELNNDGEIAFKALPAGFKIGSSETNSTTVTATNLDTLVAGKGSDASALHQHLSTISVLANGSGLGAGAAVYYNGSALVLSDKVTAAKVAGVIATTNGSDALLATAGEVGIWTPSVTSGSLNAGDNVYLGGSGGYTNYASLGAGEYVIKVGKYLGSNKVAIAIQEFGIKP